APGRRACRTHRRPARARQPQGATRAMNPNLDRLHRYPFEKLALLKRDRTPPAELDHIAMSIGEPQHAPPAFVIEALQHETAGLARYPVARGEQDLREAIALWLARRFRLAHMPDP